MFYLISKKKQYTVYLQYKVVTKKLQIILMLAKTKMTRAL